MSEIQSVVFFKNKGWNVQNAIAWLMEHDILPLKPPDFEYKKQIRFRIQNPKKFSHFITKKTKDGINLIIGFKGK